MMQKKREKWKIQPRQPSMQGILSFYLGSFLKWGPCILICSTLKGEILLLGKTDKIGFSIMYIVFLKEKSLHRWVIIHVQSLILVDQISENASYRYIIGF